MSLRDALLATIKMKLAKIRASCVPLASFVTTQLNLLFCSTTLSVLRATTVQMELSITRNFLVKLEHSATLLG